MTHHRSRVCHFVIDCDDLDHAVEFWSAALEATEEQVSEQSRHVYRKLRLPDSDIRVLLQRTDDEKVSKERMHLDLETDDVEAEVERLTPLGATRWDHISKSAVMTSGYYVIHGEMSSAFCNLSSRNCSLVDRRGASSHAVRGGRATARPRGRCIVAWPVERGISGLTLAQV